MGGPHIEADDPLDAAIGSGGAGQMPAAFFEGVDGRRADKLLLRGEMAVEAAMGQAGVGHQAGDAGRLDAVFAKARRRGLDNMFSRRVLMAFFVAHGMRPSSKDDNDAGAAPPDRTKC